MALSIQLDPTQLALEVRQLIASNAEGAYWDFKREPHANTAALLHDILCLANSLYPGNKYLIMGVEEIDQRLQITGVDATDPNRKVQAQYIDFIREQYFAGGIRPEIQLHSVELEGKTVEVLIIFERPYKPYYLTQDYSKQGKIVKANYLYTRVGDTNTPITKSADVQLVQQMWRQRFGLDILPLDRMQQLLRQPAQWYQAPQRDQHSYHQQHPEYRIKFSKPKAFWEPYSYFFTNRNSYDGRALCKYQNTTLFEIDYVMLDEMRLTLPAPEIGHVEVKGDLFHYYYYELDEKQGALLHYLTRGQLIREHRGSLLPFMFFKDRAHRKEFEAYVRTNQQVLASLPLRDSAEYAMKRMAQDRNETSFSVPNLDKLLQLYTLWRGTDVLLR